MAAGSTGGGRERGWAARERQESQSGGAPTRCHHGVPDETCLARRHLPGDDNTGHSCRGRPHQRPKPVDLGLPGFPGPRRQNSAFRGKNEIFERSFHPPAHDILQKFWAGHDARPSRFIAAVTLAGSHLPIHLSLSADVILEIHWPNAERNEAGRNHFFFKREKFQRPLEISSKSQGRISSILGCSPSLPRPRSVWEGEGSQQDSVPQRVAVGARSKEATKCSPLGWISLERCALTPPPPGSSALLRLHRRLGG